MTVSEGPGLAIISGALVDDLISKLFSMLFCCISATCMSPPF